MPFQPFIPQPEPERSHELVNVRQVHHAVVHEPITRPSQLRNKSLSPWIKWLVALAAFVTFWWVSMPFRGLIIVLAIFWFFALGSHPVIHIGRAAGDILDGDD